MNGVQNVKDTRIGLDIAVAGWTWIAAAVLMVVMWVTEDPRWGITGIVMTGIAATASVRAFIVQQCVSLRNAFDLGKDAGSVSPMQRR